MSETVESATIKTKGKESLVEEIFSQPLPSEWTTGRRSDALVIDPVARQFWVVLDALRPISHHDPAQTDKSNTSLFRRKKEILNIEDTGRLLTQEDVDRICAANPLPADIAALMAEVSLPQFVGAAVLQRFMSYYGGMNGGAGEGLFKGIERYRHLEERATHVTPTSMTLLDFWGNLCRELMVPGVDGASDEDLLKLLLIPSSLAGQVLQEMSEKPRAVLMLARVWNDHTKLQSAAYVEKANQRKRQQGEEEIAQGSTELVELRYDAANYQQIAGRKTIVQMPEVSPNSLRHVTVREPGMLHLLSQLEVGWNELSPGVAGCFYSGTGLREGAKEPMNSHQLRQIIKRTFPLLGLLSGGVDDFMLGHSSLSVNSFIVCRENNRALRQVGLESAESVFDMIDRETLNRMPTRIGEHPMPFNFETLISGARIAICYTVSPYGTDLEIGALAAAIKTFKACSGNIGGQSARGFGMVELAWHTDAPTAEQEMYEEYLQANKESLVNHLLDGTLGTEKVLCT